MPTLIHLPRHTLSHQLFISHAAKVFELKYSYIIMEGGWGQKHGSEFFRVKSIPCILSNLNLLLKYPVVAPIILINNMVPLNTIFHVIRSISKFLQYLSFFGNRLKLHVIFNIILWLKVSRNIQEQMVMLFGSIVLMFIMFMLLSTLRHVIKL